MAGFLDFLTDPRLLSMVATGMQAAGHISAGKAQVQQGEDVRALALFQADQLRQQANEALAASQRRAWSEERRANYAASATLAAAAASGGGASDPTVINIIAQQAAEGSYRQAVALYEGNTRARQLRLGATAKEYEGEVARYQGGVARANSYMAAGSTLMKGLARDASILQRFGGEGPQVGGSKPVFGIVDSDFL